MFRDERDFGELGNAVPMTTLNERRPPSGDVYGGSSCEHVIRGYCYVAVQLWQRNDICGRAVYFVRRHHILPCLSDIQQSDLETCMYNTCLQHLAVM